jgi:ribonuclease HI
MEVEAALLPPAVRMDNNLMRYAFRSLKLPTNHPVLRAIARNNYQRPTLEVNHPSQLERVELSIQDLVFFPIETIDHHIFPPWNQELPYTTKIANLTKEEATKAHLYQLQQWQGTNTLAIYSDASQMAGGKGIGVGLVAYDLATNPPREITRKKTNISTKQLVYNRELEGATLAMELGSQLASENTKVQVFVDNQAAIYRLGKPSDKPGQHWQLRSIKAGRNIRRKGAQAQINWVPGHKDIKGNETADSLAKEATKSNPTTNTGSFAVLGMKIKARTKANWIDQLAKYKDKAIAKNPRTYASQFLWTIRQQMLIPLYTLRATASAFFQLKLGHGYFKSYLASRNQTTDKCSCGAKQTPTHLLLSCKWYKEERKKLRKNLKTNLSLQLLLHTRKGAKETLEFLKRTSICTRKWMLGLEE